MEHQILIHVLSDNAKNEIEKKQFKNLDIEKLVSLAERHRLTPILFNYLARNKHLFNEQIIKQIKELTREHTLKSLNLQAELQRICSMLNRHHLNYVTIKGPQLSHLLYKDASRRVCVDLDLFLQNRDELKSAAEILYESGYRRTNYPERSNRFKQWIFSTGKHESVFINGASGTVIDLHTRPVGNTLFTARFHKLFFSEKQTYEMSGMQLYIPSIIHYFIFLCHHGAVHGYASLHWLADILAFYRKYPVAPDELLKVSEIFRLKRHVVLSLLILNRYCCISFPSELLQKWENKRIMRKFLNRFHSNLTRERNQIYTLKGRTEKTIYRFMLAEGFLGKADVLTSILTRYLYRFLKLLEFKKFD